MFDPIHAGHEAAAVAAQRALALDRVVLIPSRQPPHRPSPPQASGADRLAMARLVADAHPGWTVSEAELRREGPSYTDDTLADLAREGLSPSQMFFITGADAFEEIATWARYPVVLDRAHFVVVARPGTTLASLRNELPELAHRMTTPGNFVPDSKTTSVVLVEASTPDVSSTEIRRRLRAGDAITGMVRAEVAAYIAQHELYRT
jgi:nicotinate-nucleotide adenylyltransferase